MLGKQITDIRQCGSGVIHFAITLAHILAEFPEKIKPIKAVEPRHNIFILSFQSCPSRCLYSFLIFTLSLFFLFLTLINHTVCSCASSR